jgi:hypothetical protein
LPVANVFRELRDFFRFQIAENVEIQNVIGLQGGVGLQFSPPIALLGLGGQKPIDASTYGLLDL